MPTGFERLPRQLSVGLDRSRDENRFDLGIVERVFEPQLRDHGWKLAARRRQTIDVAIDHDEILDLGRGHEIPDELRAPVAQTEREQPSCCTPHGLMERVRCIGRSARR